MTDPPARTVLGRCAELDRSPRRPPHLERVHLTPEHARGQPAVAGLAASRPGLRTWQDAAGNQWGRREGRAPRPAGARARLAPRHRARRRQLRRDARRRHGRSRSPSGCATRRRLPFALEVVGVQRRGGHPVRQGAARQLRRSRGCGTRPGGTCATATASTLHQAFLDFGLDPRPRRRRRPRPGGAWSATSRRTSSRAPTSRRRTARWATSPRSPVPGASGSSSSARPGTPAARRTRGVATRWSARGEAIVSRSSGWPATRGCIATVGRIEVWPGAVNVIPGRAELSLDLRAATDAERDAMWDAHARARSSGDLRPAAASTSRSSRPTARRPRRARLAAGGRRRGHPRHRRRRRRSGLWSRAGHDAMAWRRSPTSGCCSCAAPTASATTPTRTSARSTSTPGLDALEARGARGRRRVEDRA